METLAIGNRCVNNLNRSLNLNIGLAGRCRGRARGTGVGVGSSSGGCFSYWHWYWRFNAHHGSRVLLSAATIRPFSSPISHLLVASSAPREGPSPVSSEEEFDKLKDDLDKEVEESELEWQKTLDAIKEQAFKMREISKEAYELYAEKAKIVLKHASEQFQVQAENAKVVLAKNAEEISASGKENISKFLENPPEPVKDITEAFGAHPEDLKKISKIHDFCVGIPYGTLLFIGGFLSFLITGSIPAVRFGVILGGVQLLLSSFSLKAWKKGESSMPYIKGQAAIATIILVRELRVLCERVTLFPGVFMAFVSVVVLMFYSYIVFFKPNESENLKPEAS